MIDKYAFGANAILLIYDVTNEQSFVNLDEWLQAAKNTYDSSDSSNVRPLYALVANKIDQEHLRVIKSERHHKFAQVSRLNRNTFILESIKFHKQIETQLSKFEN